MEEGNELSYRFSSINGEIREDEPELTAAFVTHIEGRPRAADDFYLKLAVLMQEPPTHFRFWRARHLVRQALGGYPVDDPPHDGIEMLMTEEQARANFDHFMSRRAGRREALRLFLAAFGVSPDFHRQRNLRSTHGLPNIGHFSGFVSTVRHI
jgi:hypothetical protein